jgi:hypothetical protein
MRTSQLRQKADISTWLKQKTNVLFLTDKNVLFQVFR